MANVVIIGAGICGLGAAILLARDGHDVTVLERDDHPIPDSPLDAWESWQRKGVAQFRQPHNFMPGLGSILEAELPDIQEALKHAGAARFDLLHPMPPFVDGTISILTLPGDNDTWSVTLFTASNDTALKGLRNVESWMKTVQAFPLQAHWLEGTPISDIAAMSGIVDRYKRFIVEGSPVATGIISLADAWACTNPSAGRGLTVGFIHAVLLRDVLRQTADDPLEFARQFDEMTETEVTPWYRAQIAMDRFRFAQMAALREGRDPAPPADDLTRQCASLFASMKTDPDLFRAGLEYVGTLTPVQRILQRPEIAARVADAMKAMRDSRPPQLPGPTREQLVALANE